MTPKTYKDGFFDYHLLESLTSAEEVLPTLIKYIQPNSVIDVGCGIGTWLSVWEKRGIKNVIGVDGDYVDKEKLLISEKKFITYDLERSFYLNKKFDLVMSLEVAEHLNVNSADLFIESLCSLGDVILFSAAVPGQEGTMHINEQYPNYWLKHFEKQGFVPVDCLRREIWSNDKISWWYRQNILFYVRKNVLDDYPLLKEEAANTNTNFFAIIHPNLFAYKSHKVLSYEKILKNPLSMLKYLIKKYTPK